MSHDSKESSRDAFSDSSRRAFPADSTRDTLPRNSSADAAILVSSVRYVGCNRAKIARFNRLLMRRDQTHRHHRPAYIGCCWRIRELTWCSEQLDDENI